jgi:hypothetical protein
MLRILLAGTLLLATLPTQAQQLTADAIMARVAANQDAAETARSHYLYTQHAHIASRKGKTVRCEETTDFRITPTPTGSNQQLLHLDGRLLQKGKYTTYTQLPPAEKPPQHDDTKPKDPAQVDPSKTPPAETKDDDLHISVDTGDDDMDRDLVENIRHNLTVTHSKDGISANLFPLTSKEQSGYIFTLLGREPRNGRDSFHIAFAPKDPDDFTWRGDAWIDATAFQPIVVRTAMSRKIPLAVRMLLGTNVPGLGFTIIYAPQPAIQPGSARPAQPPDPANAVWFPTSFGTEFKIHVLFFFHRDIVFNAENRDFQQTHTTAEIHDAPTP